MRLSLLGGESLPLALCFYLKALDGGIGSAFYPFSTFPYPILMSVLVGNHTRLLVQGITGSSGAFHAKSCMEYGTNVVAGVTPGKGGQMFEGKVGIFDTVAEARQETGCNATMIFVPPPFAADGILEALDAGIELIVAITEGIPVMDMMRVKEAMKGTKSVLIGPNCPGIITPGQCKIGIMPGYIHKPGNVGVVSRSGTLTYEAVWQLTARGHGQSTCIGIGGDPIHGMTHTDAARLFTEDPGTEAFILIGEIGGTEEEEAAAWATLERSFPVAKARPRPKKRPCSKLALKLLKLLQKWAMPCFVPLPRNVNAFATNPTITLIPLPCSSPKV
jgi:succinyl-CoA synthetase alpha subunit